MFALGRRGTEIKRRKTEYLCVNKQEKGKTVIETRGGCTEVEELKYLG